MRVLEIKNALETYNLKANQFRATFRDFDFQNYFKTYAQLQNVLAYHLQKQESPLAVPEMNTFKAYNQFNSYLNNLMLACYGDKFHIEALSEFVDAYKAIPDAYRPMIDGWQPSRAQLDLCDKVLSNAEYLLVFGKENMQAYIAEYLDASLAKSLVNMNEADIQGMIGYGVITEEKIQQFAQDNLLPDTSKLSKIYEALGLELPQTVSKTDIKTKGTTFNTKNGVSRQELLIELNESQDNEHLTMMPYIFKKEGQPDVPAVAIMWNGEDIANLPQPIVDSIYEQMSDPQFTLTNYEIIGGYSPNSSYGLKVSFDVTGRPKEKEVEQSQVVAAVINPMNI